MPPDAKRKTRLGKSIEVQGWDGMLAALDRIADLPRGQVPHWEQATERFYGRSQELVHVDTVALKRSGRHSTTRIVHRVIGEVRYGGTHGVDYAIFEFARGGSHDALGLAFTRVSATYARALGDMAMGAAEGS
jgi:hypothetical protein